MPSASPPLDRRELFARLAGSPGSLCTVVTSSRRLAQALARDFDGERMAAGAAAWETPDVIPFGAWVERFWDDALYSDLGASLPLLLEASQELSVWEDCLRAAQREGLLSPAAAAAQASDAWALAHAWRLAPRLASAAQHEDALAFVDWAARYERATRERGLADRARLPDLVVALLDHESVRKPREVILAGFDLLTPQQEAFLDALRALGIAVRMLAPVVRPARVMRLSFSKPDEELEAAARWARVRLEGDAAVRVAVLVPDLARSRSRVERIFTRVMDPGRMPGDERPLPFDVSLGLPLAEWPIVHDALRLLRLAGREMPFEEASALLRSPFIAGAEGERDARDALDAALRRRAPSHATLDGLVRLVQGPTMPPAPSLRAMLERLAEFRRSDLFARRGPADWARAMEGALRRAGFPGERTLDSAEYQAWSRWHEALAEFASLERVTGSMGYGEACERIQRVARAAVFQPESPAVPVQVMGILESVGLDFDALWVTGLAEDAWPMPPRANPFIPLALQKSAGIPHADARASLDLDERITAAWRAAAGEVVFSHARIRDDTEIAASALVADVAESDPVALALPDPKRERARRTSLQRVADGAGPPVNVAQRSGGTRLFKDQAACPFRAFARHRLRSEPLEQPHPGLDARDRGTLLHEMMAQVWRELGDKSRLDAMDAGSLEASLDASARAAIGKCRPRMREALAGRFEAIERERLVGTAREWLAIERTRDPFTVVSVEQKRPMTFGGITVNVTLDRMDALEAGGRAVLDYKTGAAAVGSWLGSRPDEPQLPMYTLGSAEDVRAVAFARLKRGEEMGFCGFAMEDGLLPGTRLVEDNRSAGAKEYRNWTEMIAGWRAKIEMLGTEFAQGEARVEPKRGACEQCDQHAFCRIAEKRELADE